MRRSPLPEIAVQRALRSPRVLRELLRRGVRRWAPRGARLIDVRLFGQQVGSSRRFHCTLRLRSGQTHHVVLRGNVASVDTAREASAAYAALTALERRGFGQTRYQTLRAVGFSPRLRLLLYPEVPGETAEAVLARGGKPARRAVRELGRWLKCLHDTNVRAGPRRTLRDVEREAGYFYDDFRWYAPDLVPVFTPLIAAAVQALRTIWAAGLRTARTTHGDFKPGNLLLQPQATVGIDFGNTWVTDPMSDVGNFLAQLRVFGWQRRWTESHIQSFGGLFLQAYGLAPRRRVLAYELWWHVQLLAYWLSVQRGWGRRLAAPTLRRVEVLARELRLNPWPWEARGSYFETGFLQDDRALQTFFRSHHRFWFPGADDVLRAAIHRPAAFSEDSRPLHVVLTLRLASGRPIIRSLRGNRVGPAGIAVYRRLFGSGVLVPRPLWWNKHTGYLFYEELPGTRFRDLPFRERGLTPHVRALGHTLATLHRIPPARLPTRTLQEELRFLDLQARHIRRVRPAHAAHLLRRLGDLRAWEARHWKRLPTVIAHNDFQASNILVQRDRIGLIDFGRSGKAPLPIDAGQWLAHMTVMLAPSVPEAGRRRLRRVFLNTYRAGLSPGRRRSLQTTLPWFELRAALDIVGITCAYVPDARRRDRILRPLLATLPSTPAL